MNNQDRRINLEFWIPMVLIAAGLTWFLVIPSWRNLGGSWNVSSWSKTTGRVVASRTYRSLNQERNETKYDFQYQYRVGDTDFQSRRYSFRFASGDQRLGVETHSVGDEVTVYFDPNDPAQSVIDRERNPWWNYFVLGSLILVPMAVLIRWKTIMKAAVPAKTIDES